MKKKIKSSLPDITGLLGSDASFMLASLEAMPLATTMINAKDELIFCNRKAVELYELKDKEEYLANFYKLSPPTQPDGKPSKETVLEYTKKARAEGSFSFNWLHCNLKGEEIPTEVTVQKLDFCDAQGEPLVIGFTRDLRSQFTESNKSEFIDEFFFNKVSDKILLNNITDLSAEWFWVYDIKNENIQFFGKGREILNLSTEKYPFPSGIVDSNLVFEEDVEEFLTFAKSAKEGISEQYDIRFVLPDGNTRYFRIAYKNIFSKNNEPMFAIGKTSDIHDQKSYEMLSQTDQLTNCFNKVTTENLSKKAIQDFPNNSHALFIIDVDNFKAINDNLGHHFGDMVLTEISNKLRSHFRDGDIIGRIGGDEFVVFLKNIENIETIKQKAESIARTFQNTYSGDNYDYKISGSIGIALYSKDSDNFSDLYKCADKALYQSKQRGKDCYTFYNSEFVDSSIKDLTIVENANRAGSSFVDSELVNTIFDSIYDSKMIHTSLDAVLGIIGNKLNIDRAYIYTTDTEEDIYHITNEWNSSRVEKRIDQIRTIQRDDLAEIFDLLDEKDTIYFFGTSEFKQKSTIDFINAQGAKSNLILQAQNQTTMKLGLALADCTKERVWTEKEVNTMRYAIKLISIFKLSEKGQKIRMNEKEAMKQLSQEEVDALQTLMLKGVVASD